MPAQAKTPDASGTVASHKYEYQFPDGTKAYFTVALCPSDDSETAKAARDKGAQAHGLVAVVGVPRAPSHPMRWMLIKDAFVTVVAPDDPAVSDELRRMLVPVMRAFFKDVRGVAPGLADSRLE